MKIQNLCKLHRTGGKEGKINCGWYINSARRDNNLDELDLLQVERERERESQMLINRGYEYFILVTHSKPVSSVYQPETIRSVHRAEDPIVRL